MVGIEINVVTSVKRELLSESVEDHLNDSTELDSDCKGLISSDVLAAELNSDGEELISTDILVAKLNSDRSELTIGGGDGIDGTSGQTLQEDGIWPLTSPLYLTPAYGTTFPFP